MICTGCKKEYRDDFRFCPFCAETNPAFDAPGKPGDDACAPVPAAEGSRLPVPPPAVPAELPPGSGIRADGDTRPDALTGGTPGRETGYRKPGIMQEGSPTEDAPGMLGSAGEKLRAAASWFRSAITLKTIALAAAVLILIAGGVTAAVVLLRPSYPDEFVLGSARQDDLVLEELAVTRLDQRSGRLVFYRLTGEACGKWDGTAEIVLELKTVDGDSTARVKLDIARNRESSIRQAFTSRPVVDCSIKEVVYKGEMKADDFFSVDNIFSGQTLDVGEITVLGSIIEADCSVTLNGVPVTCMEDGSFSAGAAIAEGANSLVFEVTEPGGSTASRTIAITGQLTPEQYKAAVPGGPPYNELNKNPGAFSGTPAYYRGKVVQAMESAGATTLRVDVTPRSYGYWKDTIYVVLDGTTPALEDNIVDVYGVIVGGHTYTSVAGYQITLPRINARYVDVVQ